MGRVKDEGRGSAAHANPTPVFHVPALDGEAEARPRVRLQWNLLRWIVDRVAQPKARDVERSERLPEVARPRSRREIGRASCRERVEMRGVGGGLEVEGM